MTLLEDVLESIKTVDQYRYDIKDITDATGAAVEERGIYLDTMRWGDIMGIVLARYNHTGSPTFEYVMVTEYVYSGDSDGDLELDAYAVVPETVRKIVWSPVCD